MGKIIITELNEKIISGYYDGEKILDLNIVTCKDEVSNGDIYIGYVENIVKNLNAAFVEVKPGIKGYLDLNDNTSFVFINPKNTDKLCIGDKILVQVIREPIKSKPVTLSSEIALSGKRCVILGSDTGKISVSAKVKDTGEKERLDMIAKDLYSLRGYSGILRTNCIGADIELIKEEYLRLSDLFEDLIKKASVGIKDQLLLKGIPAYLSLIRDLPENNIDEIVTDRKDLYDEIRSYLNDLQREDLDKLKLYEDESFPLKALYSLEHTLDSALSKNVWLKSGAYLVIEYTEAMTVIDVNSGKAIKTKGNFEETALKLNLEAADELIYQLRLRNLSGMIIVDFISMKNKENREKLFEYLKERCKKESVRTEAMDITKLGLIEITRKRISKPVYECL